MGIYSAPDMDEIVFTLTVGADGTASGVSAEFSAMVYEIIISYANGSAGSVASGTVVTVTDTVASEQILRRVGNTTYACRPVLPQQDGSVTDIDAGTATNQFISKIIVRNTLTVTVASGTAGNIITVRVRTLK